MRTRRPAEKSRQSILDAAIGVFARHGYAGTSVQDVLDEVGLSKPTLYYHFASKAGLFRAILDHAFDESFRLMRAGGEGRRPTEEHFVAVAAGMFRFATTHVDLTRLVYASLFAAPGEIPAECLDPARRCRNFDYIRKLMVDAQAAGELGRDVEANDLAHGLLGAISHRIRTHLLSPENRLDRAVALRVVNLFLKGARAHP